MKKRVLLLVSVLLLLFATVVHADDNIKVYINDKETTFDVAPQITNDRTMVPLRKIFESLGCTVKWVQDEQLIVAHNDSTLISMMIGSDVLLVYDMTTNTSDQYTLDSVPVIIDGRTLVPLRAISESLGADVSWDGESKTIKITLDGVKNISAPSPVQQ